MICKVSQRASNTICDDLNEDQLNTTLAISSLRECGATGWAGINVKVKII